MKRASIIAILALAVACEEPSLALPPPEDPLPLPELPPEDERRATVVHAVEPFELEGSEETMICYSWTVDNDAPLYIEGVTFQNGGSLHHSNWFVVPEDVYPGEDGYWPCASRGFEDVSAALSGTVLFAQSTQAQKESARFGEGAVIRIPPRSKVVAGVHLLNLSPDPKQTEAWMSLDLLHPGLVQRTLSPVMLTYQELDVPANARSRFTGVCDVGGLTNMRPIEIHYVLPHFHSTGVSASIEFVDESGAATTVLDHTGFAASALGQTLDPPVVLEGAGSLRYSCGYDNPYDQNLKWGIGINEMCIFLALAWSDDVIAGAIQPGTTSLVAETDGVIEYEAPCHLAVSRRGRAYDLPTREELSGPLVLPPIASQDVPEPPSCEDTPGTEPSMPPTYDEVSRRVFQPYCTFSSCHGNGTAAGLDLREGAAVEGLVGVDAIGDGIPRVAAGDAEGSYLYRLLSACEPRGGGGGAVRHMPAGAPTLLDAELVGLVRAWIDDGAPG